LSGYLRVLDLGDPGTVTGVSIRDLEEPWVDLSLPNLERIEGCVATYLEEARRAHLQTGEVERLIGVLSLARLGDHDAEAQLAARPSRLLLAEIVLWYRNRLRAEMERRMREDVQTPGEIVALAERQGRDLERLRSIDGLLVWKPVSKG